MSVFKDVYPELQFGDSFRLLEIEPAENLDSPLVCRLRPSRFSESPSYDALSYAWQSDDAEAPPLRIRCNGHDMLIRSNLWQALRRLRGVEGQKPRVIWADAMCINQANMAERNHQVRQMSLIYREAEEVIIWLGEEPKAEEGIDVAAGFGAIKDSVQRWARDRDLWDAEADRARLESVDDFSELLIPTSARRLSRDEVRAVVHVYQRAWFQRLWVIQEVALAVRPRVQLGRHTAAWDTVGMAAVLLHGMPEIVFASEDVGEGFRVLESARKIHLARTASRQAEHPFEFHDLLVMTRLARCQDERDRIFGMLAIRTTRGGVEGTNYRTEADYRLSTREVFQRSAVEMLEAADNLDLLSDCQHDEGTELGMPGPGTYPSWVPQWHVHPHMRLMFVSVDNRYEKYQAAGGRKRELEWTADGRPRVRGAEMVRVKEVSRALTEELFDKERGQGAVFGEGPAKNKEGGLFLPGSTIRLASSEIGPNTLRLMVQTLTGLCDIQTAKVGEYALALQQDLLRWSFPNVFGTGEERKVVEEHAALAKSDTEGLVEWMKMVCANRRLFMTETGEVGLGPGVVRPGDVVCVLYGTRVPIVLRQVGAAWAVVGECYVDRLMLGEAMAGDCQDRWFELV